MGKRKTKAVAKVVRRRARRSPEDRGLPGCYVLWKDSTSVRGWTSRREAAKEEFLEIESLGWLVCESRTRVTIALSHDGQEKVNDYLILPRACTIRMVQLPLRTRATR